MEDVDVKHTVAGFEEVLRGKGLRRTVPRMMILSILVEASAHLSASGLHHLVTAAQPTISVSTVYRNVTTMTEHGLLHSVEHTGQAHFGIAAAPHHHLLCERCGVLADMAVEDLAQTAASLLARTGFEITPSGQVLRGRCLRCRTG
ncbi:Fur family transcriptional regulator [Streptosporangium sp. NPDC049046]|uniref:Fur family transcriptional regulator n=1 Tax=Streptosporangium sp. NPDC049046 TaxID=3155031 RepID=UPI0034394562